MIPANASTLEIVEQAKIKFPGCDAIFSVANVYAVYAIATNYDDLPVYMVSFPGDKGRLTCDSPAHRSYNGSSWSAAEPMALLSGGGSSLSPDNAGWQDGYGYNVPMKYYTYLKNVV
jgi:hypothetical protein